jgi:hypothetical protein
MRVAGLLLLACLPALSASACKRAGHVRVASYAPPPLPAGFVEHSGTGWRIAVPSTWREASSKDQRVFAVADPQAVDQFHAYANVITEPFGGESDLYARASEAGLRHNRTASVEATREDVVDGDPTLILESRWEPAATAIAYRTMQVALASRGIGYVVTCAVSVTAFERYRSTCESIVRSLAVER